VGSDRGQYRSGSAARVVTPAPRGTPGSPPGGRCKRSAPLG
jgi:hypothetical protein